jgi:hypothetical protein
LKPPQKANWFGIFDCSHEMFEHFQMESKCTGNLKLATLISAELSIFPASFMSRHHAVSWQTRRGSSWHGSTTKEFTFLPIRSRKHKINVRRHETYRKISKNLKFSIWMPVYLFFSFFLLWRNKFFVILIVFLSFVTRTSAIRGFYHAFSLPHTDVCSPQTLLLSVLNNLASRRHRRVPASVEQDLGKKDRGMGQQWAK